MGGALEEWNKWNDQSMHMYHMTDQTQITCKHVEGSWDILGNLLVCFVAYS